MKQSRQAMPVMLGIIGAAAILAATVSTGYRAGPRSVGSAVELSAKVSPQRVIVVAQDLSIREVISNTPQEVTPVIRLGSPSGPELEFSNQVAAEYRQLEPALDFSRYGTVYEAPAPSFWESAISGISGTLSWVISLFKLP